MIDNYTFCAPVDHCSARQTNFKKVISSSAETNDMSKAHVTAESKGCLMNGRFLKCISVYLTLLCLFLLTSCGHPLQATESSSEVGQPLKVELTAEETAITAGNSFWLAVHFDLQAPWHAYWKNPGDTGMAPRLDWQLPAGLKVVDVLWPTPQRTEHEGLVSFGYDAPFTLLAQIEPSADLKADDTLDVGLEVSWVACSGDTCQPGEEELSLKLAVAKSKDEVAIKQQAAFAKARAALPRRLEHISLHCEGNLFALKFDNKALQLGVETVEKVNFFPEDSDTIDHHAAVKWMSPDSNQDEFLVLLQRGIQDTNHHLKGLLQIENARGTEYLYVVDTHLSADSKPLASMNDVADLTLSGPAEQQPASKEVSSPVIDYGVEGFLMAMVLAFLGGMCLNLMPCVLPVISLKVLGFVKMAGQSRSVAWRHGLAFCAGIMISFWVLAGLMLILQAYGSVVGWGFQLQEPLFVAILAAIITVFALSLFGVFELGAFFAAWVGTQGAQSSEANKDSIWGSFSNGVLATAVATPCTGPFLGSAIGFAFTLPAFQALLVFTSLGLGMALPYLLLAAFPQLLRFLPKPGNWMVAFKELMGFMMLATALWLVWVFGAQTDTMAVSLLLLGLFSLSLGVWIYGRWGTPWQAKSVRILSLCLLLGCGAFGGYVINEAANVTVEAPVSDSSNISSVNGWEAFNPQRLKDLQAEGVPVFIDFTAKWCLICQTNHLVLSRDNVVRTMAERGIVKMKADWTKGDPQISEWLRQYGRNGVPLYLMFDAEGEVAVLPQVLTPQVVLDSLGT
jgi:thiol:disulfide interchange protein